MLLEAVEINWISFLAYHLVYSLIFFSFILFAQSCLCVWKRLRVLYYCRGTYEARGKTCSKSCKEKNRLLAKSEVRTTVIHVIQRPMVGCWWLMNGSGCGRKRSYTDWRRCHKTTRYVRQYSR